MQMAAACVQNLKSSFVSLEKQTELHQPLIHVLGTFLHLAKTALLLKGYGPQGSRLLYTWQVIMAYMQTYTSMALQVAADCRSRLVCGYSSSDQIHSERLRRAIAVFPGISSRQPRQHSYSRTL